MIFVNCTASGAGPKRPPQVFLRAIPKRLEISSSYLVTFPKYSLPASGKKVAGSGHQSKFVDPTSEKFAVMPEVEFFMVQFHLFVCS